MRLQALFKSHLPGDPSFHLAHYAALPPFSQTAAALAFSFFLVPTHPVKRDSPGGSLFPMHHPNSDAGWGRRDGVCGLCDTGLRSGYPREHLAVTRTQGRTVSEDVH